jgi:PAS domain-containing protein
VYCVLHDGKISHVSSSSLDVSGIPPEQFVGEPATEVVHPDDHPTIARLLAPGWAGSFSERIRVRDADGSWSWRLMSGVRTMDDEGHASATVRLRRIAEPKAPAHRRGQHP